MSKKIKAAIVTTTLLANACTGAVYARFGEGGMQEGSTDYHEVVESEDTSRLREANRPGNTELNEKTILPGWVLDKAENIKGYLGISTGKKVIRKPQKGD